MWYPGVAQWSSGAVFFAPRAVPTAWTDLCQLDMQIVELEFVEPRARDALVRPQPPANVHYYAPASPRPAMRPARAGPADEARCAALTPFLARQNWHLAHVQFNGAPADPAQAAFAYRAVAAAADAPRIDATSCGVDVEPRCRDPRRFLRALDLRDLWQLSIAPCEGHAASLCVTALIESASATGGTIMVIATDGGEIGPPRRVRVGSVRIRAELYPVA